MNDTVVLIHFHTNFSQQNVNAIASVLWSMK